MKTLKMGLSALLVTVAALTGATELNSDPQPAYYSPEEARLAALREGKMLYVMLGFDSCYYLSQLRAYVTSLGNSFTDDFVYCYVSTDTGVTYGLDDETYSGSPYWGVFDPRVYKVENRWAEDNGRLILVGGWAGESGTDWYLDLARSKWASLSAAPTSLVINAPTAINQETAVTATLSFADGTMTDVTKAVEFSVTSGDAASFSGDGRLTPVRGAAGEVTIRVQGEFWGMPYDDTMTVSVEIPSYTVRFHKNDGSDDVTAEQGIESYVEARLDSLAKLGWAKRGFEFLGWGKYPNLTTVWLQNGAEVTDLAEIGETVDLYGIWAVASDSYAIEFIRNDGAGTWRWVGFKHGVKTRMPSLANGLKWARRGYEFKGWELTTADANDNTRAAPWKGDWAYVASPVAKGGKLIAYARWALKPGYYQIRFNRNDGGGKWRTLGFERGKGTKLSTIGALGWERDGYEFVGWASSKANADAGKLWKPDGAWVTNAAAEGKTLSIYAIWRKE